MEETNKPLPDLSELKAELNRVNNKKEYRRIFRNTTFAIVVVAALAILISSFFITVLRITGESMAPTLSTGEIVITNHNAEFEIGDLVAFYYNNRVLVKRVIGNPGDWIDIDEDGTVSVNGEILEEPYLSDASLEPYDITFPYQVPESRFFVMGDKRSVSIDSRSATVGCIAEEQVIGKLLFRVYPFESFGKIQ